MTTYSLFGTSGDPNIKPLPRRGELLTCKVFDDLTAKKILVFENYAFGLHDEPKLLDITFKLGEKVKQKYPDEWTLFGSLGDVSAHPALRKNFIGTFGDFKNMVVSSQKVVTKATISKMREYSCGHPLP
jgi:hypothetical protein